MARDPVAVPAAGHELDLGGDELTSPTVDALDLTRMTLDGACPLRPQRLRPDDRGAGRGARRDTARGWSGSNRHRSALSAIPRHCGWAVRHADSVLLDGFAYGALNDTRSVDVRKRLHCIARVSDGYAPAFCDRLSAAYQCARQDEMAEPVLIARQHRRYATTGPAARIRGALQRWTVGHGYRPWLAVCWSIGVWALGTDWFAFHERCRSTPTRTPASNPRLFAADMPPPIVDLGQDGYRRLVGASQ